MNKQTGRGKTTAGYIMSVLTNCFTLVPALIFFVVGHVLARVKNRRTWSLIASGVLLALSAVMLAGFPKGW